MERPASDIIRAMEVDSQRSGSPGLPGVGHGAVPLDGKGFSQRFEPLRETFQLIAAAVLGGRNDAEDVVQEAAVIGLRKLEEFEPSTSFSAWMAQIVRNVARNHARKQSRRRTIPADPGSLDRAESGQPLRPGDRVTDLDSRVLLALNELEEVPRMCLLLRTVRQMPYRDIAMLLEIPEGTAMSHVHRSRRALRERLASLAGDLSP
jgi:RNA polymerase sigma-70 factor, ECF subfamily